MSASAIRAQEYAWEIAYKKDGNYALFVALYDTSWACFVVDMFCLNWPYRWLASDMASPNTRQTEADAFR